MLAVQDDTYERERVTESVVLKMLVLLFISNPVLGLAGPCHLQTHQPYSETGAAILLMTERGRRSELKESLISEAFGLKDNMSSESYWEVSDTSFKYMDHMVCLMVCLMA